MIKEALRRANRSYVFIVTSALLFVAGFVGSTYAYFDGQTQLTATYAGGYIASPTSPTVTASGYDGLLTWTAATPMTTTTPSATVTVSAQRIVASDNGTSTNCTSASFGVTVVASLPSTQTTYTDANRANGSGNGHQWCYGFQNVFYSGTTNATTTFATPSWYQQTNQVAQLGLAAQSVVASSGGTSNSISRNDTLTITYNQKPSTPSTGVLCLFPSSSTILVGDSDCTDVNNDSYAIGKITGVTNSGNGTDPIPIVLANSGGMVVSGSAPWTITLTIKTNSGATIGGWNSGTFTNSSSLQSAAGSPQASGCTSCSVTPSGSW